MENISSTANDQKILSGFSGSGAKMEQSSASTRFSGEDMIKIADRFFLTTTKYSHQYYNAYNGIDVKDGKWVVAYLKLVPPTPLRPLPSSTSQPSSRKISGTWSAPRSSGKDQSRSIALSTMQKCMIRSVLAWGRFFGRSRWS